LRPTARVVKAVVAAPDVASELGGLDFFDFHLFPDMGVAGNDLDIRNEDLGSLNLPQVDEHGL
jgi:hypothetical protein